MAETVVKEKKQLVNPFCFVPNAVHFVKCGNPIIKRYKGIEVDAETHQTRAVYEDVNLVEEIQSRKMDCGFDYMARLLRTGQAKPSDFADDGQHGFDGTAIPETIHEAAKLAEENNQMLQQVASALGLSPDDVMTQSMIENALKNKVAELFAAQQQAAAAAAEGEEK